MKLAKKKYNFKRRSIEALLRPKQITQLLEQQKQVNKELQSLILKEQEKFANVKVGSPK